MQVLNKHTPALTCSLERRNKELEKASFTFPAFCKGNCSTETQQAEFPSVIWIHIHLNDKSLILITNPRILPHGSQAVCGSLAEST